EDAFAKAIAYRHAPAMRNLVEARRAHLGLIMNVGRDPKLIGAATEVRVELLLSRKVLRPLGIRSERVAVQVVGDVDATAGIGVLEPGATECVVLLENGVADAGLAQANAGQYAGHPGADDDHRKRIRRARPPLAP